MEYSLTLDLKMLLQSLEVRKVVPGRNHFIPWEAVSPSEFPGRSLYGQCLCSALGQSVTECLLYGL